MSLSSWDEFQIGNHTSKSWVYCLNLREKIRCNTQLNLLKKDIRQKQTLPFSNQILTCDEKSIAKNSVVKWIKNWQITGENRDCSFENFAHTNIPSTSQIGKSQQSKTVSWWNCQKAASKVYFYTFLNFLIRNTEKKELTTFWWILFQVLSLFQFVPGKSLAVHKTLKEDFMWCSEEIFKSEPDRSINSWPNENRVNREKSSSTSRQAQQQNWTSFVLLRRLRPLR